MVIYLERTVTKIKIRWDSKRQKWKESGERRRLRWVVVCPVCRANHLRLRAGAVLCGDCVVPHHQMLIAFRAPAMKAVGAAIVMGLLPKLSGSVACVDCERPAQVYDHRAYARPLDVQPVCRSCNSRRGPAKELAELVLYRADGIQPAFRRG